MKNIAKATTQAFITFQLILLIFYPFTEMTVTTLLIPVIAWVCLVFVVTVGYIAVAWWIMNRESFELTEKEHGCPFDEDLYKGNLGTDEYPEKHM